MKNRRLLILSLLMDGYELIQLQYKSTETRFNQPNNGGEAPTHIVPNPDQIIQPPIPPNNEEVVETQPVLPAEDELLPVLQPMPVVPDHT